MGKTGKTAVLKNRTQRRRRYIPPQFKLKGLQDSFLRFNWFQCPLILNDNENVSVQFNNSMLVRKTSFKAIDTGIIILIVNIRNLLL